MTNYNWHDPLTRIKTETLERKLTFKTCLFLKFLRDLILEYIFFPLIKLNRHWFSTSLSNMTKILEDIIIIIVCANLFRINHWSINLMLVVRGQNRFFHLSLESILCRICTILSLTTRSFIVAKDLKTSNRKR